MRHLLGEADGRYLWLGERHPRRARAVGAVPERGVRLAGDLVGGHSGLVLGHMGEQCAAVGVPDDPEPVVAGDLQVLVDGQVAVLARLYPDGVEAELVGVDMPPDRDEQLIAGERAAVVQLHGHLACAARTLHLRDLDIGQDLGALFA